MKKLRPKASLDELCYPFMYEDSLQCDYEICTDQLTRLVGWIIDELEVKQSQIQEVSPQLNALYSQLIQELNTLQPLCYHLNGSIRGKLAIMEEDHQWLLKSYQEHKLKVADAIHGFVLPRGAAPVGQLNQASSLSKQAIRYMVRIHNQEQIEVPDILPKFANLLCNYFFILTVVLNQAQGLTEIPFESKSY